MSDAKKKRVPDEAPFPAGLLDEKTSSENKDVITSEEIEASPEKTNEDEPLADTIVGSEEAKDES